jgi:hypothetical protein
VLATAWLAAGAVFAADTTSQRDPMVVAGERIYRTAILPDGGSLHGLRENQTIIQGASAACVNCHRRSGLGTIEGPFLAPPITVKYLRRSVEANARDLEMAHVEGYQQRHAAYTDATLAAALRSGVTPDGRTLNGLMPRYDLDAGAMQDLLVYLGQLGAGPFPGVSEKELEFATIVTPDADPVEKQAMLDVMERFFGNQSAVIAAESRPMKSGHEIRYRVTRQWRLHVWELKGEPETWELQLHDFMSSEPVFAVVSGLGKATWAPVHRFCESEHVPCLFPNVDVPVVNETDFYPVYFSRGVLLEADLFAEWLASAPSEAARHLIQVFRQADAGVAGAAALHAAAAGANWTVTDRALPTGASAKDLRAALTQVGPEDTVVLWLRPDDLKSLPARPPTSRLLASGLMGGLDSAPLPAEWLKQAHMSYPVDLPEQRLARMNFPYGWFKVQHLPITAERVQIDTYLACVITSEAVGHLFDSFVPEFLLERMEMMISRRLANAYFPRLGLAPGQRFASKGGYIVHFDKNATAAALPSTADPIVSRAIKVIADTDWMAP